MTTDPNMEDSKSRSLNRGHYLTKPERMFLEECQIKGIEIEKQFPLKNSFILDFAIPDKKYVLRLMETIGIIIQMEQKETK